MDLIPPKLVRVKEFLTFKVYDASQTGHWALDAAASGPDLAETIGDWQKETKAQITRAEAPRADPHREGERRYRVILTTFVYYVPASEGMDDTAAAKS